MQRLRMIRSDSRESGTALLVALTIAVLVLLLCAATLLLGSAEVSSAVHARRSEQALYVAEAGVEAQIVSLKAKLGRLALAGSLDLLDGMAGTTTFSAQTLSKDGQSVGQFTVDIQDVTAGGEWTRDVTIRSRGFVPGADAPNRVQRTVVTVVRVRWGLSRIFDYVYFMNNQGMLHHDRIYADGNVGSNGLFSSGSAKAKIDGLPRFEEVSGADLIGYIDDNGDGIPGNDGGIYAGWSIDADSVSGQASETWSAGDAAQGSCDESEIGMFKNQHEFRPAIPMPSLADLTVAESTAKAANSWIKVGDTVVVNSVLGDQEGEPQNLYLEGTPASPIWINGPVVVRGNVIISGTVKGKGVLFAGGNVYTPKNLTYETAPVPLPRPGSRNEFELENWLLHNKFDTDFLGLFARGHVVVGDFTDSVWREMVTAPLSVPENMSKEDAGLDGVPNTAAGRDGVPGTVDDDVLENDGTWTVDRFKQADADLGLLPLGAAVGDVVPGSGEDSDGDGQYDGPLTVSDFDLTTPLEAPYWAGNFPAGVASYAEISTTGVYRLDAAFYADHAVALLANPAGEHMEVNGCLIGRTDAICILTKDLIMNYDYRLMASDLVGISLPKTLLPMEILRWTSD